MDAHGRLFNRIAVFYQWFFRYQTRIFRKLLSNLPFSLDLPQNAKILDVGCGTGAFGYSFKQLGYEITGIDIAPNMVKKGQKNGVNCIINDLTNGVKFADQSFDLVIASHFLHGLKPDLRNKVFEEIGRVTKRKILFYDYNVKTTSKRRWTRLIETVEGGEYFGFMKTGLHEMEHHFDMVKVYEIDGGSAFYLCLTSNFSKPF